MDFAFSNKIMDKGRSADGTTVAEKSTIPIAPAGSAVAAADTPPGDNDTGPVPQRVRVSQGVSQGLLTHQVAPVYPEVARANRVSGKVVLQAIIGKNGRLTKLYVVSGPPELREAAIGAVQQWRYKPYYLKGQPVEVETQITVNFALR
jgi:protein TonB